jgi:UDP-N-acetylglucosamine--N-acetylmuramyl-(pentapeptide) pyrophosphoryl-undecaprenol N-acetylglucosamine transferase
MAAGGTGGHVWPAVAVAQAIRRQRGDARFLFVGAGRPVEAAILDPLGFPRETIPARGLKGRGLAGKAASAGTGFLGLVKALSIIRRFKPHLAFGAGGYATGPVGLAAFLSRTPLAIHEQNQKAGLTNRYLGKMARQVFLGAAGSEGFAPEKTMVVGNPVREAILRVERRARPEGAPFTLLLLGGSQGARALNRALGAALPFLAQKRDSYRIIHQAGAAGLAETRELYEGSGLNVELLGFAPDIERLYGEADLAVARAGALTIAELRAVGLPAILTPLPTAADDHQSANARAMAERGAALWLPESEATGERLFSLIESLRKDAPRLLEMGRKARELFAPDAAEAMARRVLEIVASR